MLSGKLKRSTRHSLTTTIWTPWSTSLHNDSDSL